MTTTQNLNTKLSTLIYFITIVLILNFKLQGQNNDFVLSSSEKTDNISYTFGAGNNLFYTYNIEDETTILYESFSINDLKSKIKTKIVLPKIDDKKQKFENILHVNQSTCLFTSTYDKKSKIYTFYAYKVNDNGQLNTEGIKIDEISSKENGDRNYINFSLSNDSNNILIAKTFDKIVSADEIKGQISYKVLDGNLKIIFNNQIELKRLLIAYKISNLLLDKNNNLFFLISEQKYNKEIKDSRVNYTVNLYSSKDSKLFTSEVNIDEIHLLDATILINENEQLICTGTYAIDKTFNDQWMTKKCVKGMFYEIFDKNNLAFISKNKTNISEKFPDYMFYDNYLTHSFELKNNKIIVICEYQSKTITKDYSFISYGSLLVSSFDLKNANNTWSKIIENDTKKNTTKCKDGTVSYVLFKKENSFKILYNCNRQINVDENGDIDEKNIFTESQQFLESFSSSSNNCYFQNNYNSIVLSTYSKSNGYKYAKLTIK